MAAGLAGCGSLAGDACVDPDTTANNTVLNKRDVTPRNCDGSFLSARNQREVLYGGDDHPRLYTGEGVRTGGGIDTSKLDVASPSGKASRPITAYLGSLRIDYQPNDPTVPGDADAILRAPGVRANPDQTVSVDFKRATIDFVVKQMLGGALGLNYIAPDDLGGSITFKTEEPIPKSRILQIVRDLLARNGLEMRSINGIYHIGKPDLIASIEGLSEAGRGNDRVTRIVRLRKGTAAEVAGLAKQMLPSNVNVLTTNSPDTLLLRAPTTDIDQAEGIIKNLAASDSGDDRVAIIPVHQSAPDQIAAQIGEIYHSRGADVTIVPLVQQQGILVTARDASVMKGIRALVRTMDTEVRDEVALRLIPLQHLNASDTADRLATIFGGGGGGNAGSGNGRGGSGGRSSSGLGSGGGSAGSGPGTNSGFGTGGSLGGAGTTYPTPPTNDVVQDGSSTAYPSPAESPGEPGFAGTGRRGTGTAGGSRGGGGGGGGGGPSRGGGAGGDDQTKIVADKTSNSVMVYSTYATFKRIREVLQTLDVAQAQVVIEATIVEVTLNDQIQQGVQFFLTGRGFSLGSGDVSNLTGGTASGTTVSGTASTGTTGTTATGSTGMTSTGTGTGSALTNNNGGALSIGANITKNLRVDAVLSALQGITKVKVISSPYLTVTNGKQARLVVGDQIPYSTRTQSANNLGNNTTTNEVTIKDTGIILDITPDIHANNEVGLKISQSVSTPTESSPLGGTLTPVISTRSVDSEVLLQSGRTVLLGGLIQDRLEQQEGGVPVLRTVPGIGDLFKSKTDNVQRVELILMLTPRVTRSSSQIEDLAHLIQAQVHAR